MTSWFKKNKWLIKIIGVAIFAYILVFQVDLRKSAAILSRVRLELVLFALILAIPAVFVKAVRWWTLLKSQGTSLGLKDTITVYCIGMLGGFVTPGQLGDFVKVYYLRRDGQSMAKSFSSVLYDRLFDVLVYVLFGLAGFLIVYGLWQEPFVQVIVLIGSCLTVICLAFRDRLGEWAMRSYRLMVQGRLSSKMRARVDDFIFVTGLVFSRGIFKKLFLYSIAGMIIYLARVYILAMSLNMDMTMLDLVACVSVVQLVTIVPVSIADVGTRDGALILTLARFGVEQEYAVSLSLLILLLALLNAAIGFVAWLRHPLHGQNPQHVLPSELRRAMEDA